MEQNPFSETCSYHEKERLTLLRSQPYPSMARAGVLEQPTSWWSGSRETERQHLACGPLLPPSPASWMVPPAIQAEHTGALPVS